MEHGSAYNYAMEKTANIGDQIAKNPMQVATATLGALGLGANVMKTLINKIQNDMRRKAIIEDLANYDPILKNVDREQLKEWFATMYFYAPSMTADKNTVKEVLTGFARFGKIDLPTLKTLSETEEKLRKSRSDSFIDYLISPVKK